jgi:hypothetical protein
MTGRWFIDGIDIFLNWKIGIEKASEDLLRFPPKKESIVHDWKDAHGKDYDLSKKYFDERISTLDLWIITDSEDEFWTNRNALIAQLMKPGLNRLTLANHGMRDYFFFYVSTSSWKDVVKLRGENGEKKIGHKFQITICEPQPQAEGEIPTAIADEDNRIIIT